MAALVSRGTNVWQQRKLKKAGPDLRLSEGTQRTQLLTTTKDGSDSQSQIDKDANINLILGIQKRLDQINFISDSTKPQETKPETEPEEPTEGEELPPIEEEKELTVSEKLDKINLSLRLRKKAKSLLKDEDYSRLLNRMIAWLSSNEERALKFFKNIQKENCFSYKNFVGAMIDLDSPFRIFESYVLVVKLSTQKGDLISIEDIMSCLPPKKLLTCDICGFGKTAPGEVPKPLLTGFQMLFNFPKTKEPTTTYSPWKTQAKDSDIKIKPTFKAMFTNLKKKPSQDSRHKVPSLWANRTQKLGTMKKLSSYTSQSKMTPGTVNDFVGLKRRAFSTSSQKSKETELDKEGGGTQASKWQLTRKRTQHVLKVRMSRVGKMTEQTMPHLDRKAPSFDDENQTGMMRLTKRTTSKTLPKRASSIKMRERPDAGKKIFGRLIDGEKTARVKNMFAKAVGIGTNTNDATPMPSTSIPVTKTEEIKTPVKKDMTAFSEIRKMERDEKENSNKTAQPYLIERYILVQLRYIVYDDILSCSLHFSILLTNSALVSYIAHCIKENIEVNCKEVYISPNRLRLRQTVLSPDHTLKQCSYRGYCKSHPQKITFYYDIDLPSNTPFIASLNP